MRAACGGTGKPAKVIGVTLGDPAGVGPEILVKALSCGGIRGGCAYVVFGDRLVLEREQGRLKTRVAYKEIKRTEDARSAGPGIFLRNLSNLSEKDSPPGRMTEKGARAQLGYFREAVAAARAGMLDAVVTAPAGKAAFSLAGGGEGGHTEILRQAAAAGEELVMFFAAGRLRVGLATEHCALSDVPRRISEGLLLGKLRVMDRALTGLFRIKGPKIAVCGLNPHAGEGGMYGTEETEIIGPAIEAARSDGIRVEGPFAADALFWRLRRGEFDAALAMYHDQGLGPVKTALFRSAVHLTLGLPFVRTSPAHGSAYDIAGKGVADPGSMEAAIRMASRLARIEKK